MKRIILTLFATVALFNFTNAQSYCTPASTDCSGDMITNVTISTINNTTTCSPAGYGAYTSPTATLNTGVSYPISVTVSAGYTECISVWIDYNQDGIFDSTEFTSIGCGDGVAINSIITIPGTATLGVTTMRVRAKYSSSLTAADACSAYMWGETEDYVITIAAGTACTGIPTAGIASADSAACSAVDFDLVLTGYTSGVSGITFQWQSSSTGTAGTFTNITGATTSTYITSQTATTHYMCIVTCSGGTLDTSNLVTVTMNTIMDCHCIPASSNCSFGDVITNVTIGAINNTTTCSPAGYGSYISPTTTLNTGISYPVSVTVGSGGTEYVAIWIDYNQNGTFDTTEFTAIGSGNGVTINSTITIPGTAVSGNTKMRVRVGYGSQFLASDACITYFSAETEDYLVTIAAGTACTGTPVAGTASADSAVCSGIDFDLALTGYTSGVSGITFQWQSSSTGTAGTFTNITGATTSTYTTSQTASTFYQCIVTCSGSSSATSNSVVVSLNTPNTCYCIPPSTNCATTDVITNVTIGTINNTTTCSPAGYGSYSTPTTTLNQGVSYPISVTVGSSTQHVGVWVDYNQNGAFETTEFTYAGTGNTVITSTIAIPGTATLGATKMRVRARWNTILTSTDACSAYSWGETEDYVITIGTGTACTGTPVAGTASVTANTVCSGENFDLVLTGYTSGVSGITFQWTSSSSLTGSYSSITGVTTSTYTTSQTDTTYYMCIVTCSGSTPSAFSNIIPVTMNTFMNCYCTSSATTTSDEEILNVTVGTLNNSSTCTTTGGTGSVLNKYSDYTGVTAPDLLRGNAIPFSISIGTCGTNPYTSAFKIFIDYNQNGSFADAGETVYTSDTTTGVYTQTGTFTVPSTATLGYTLMRVVNTETGGFPSYTIDSCGTYASGETEDYTVNITSPAGIDENSINDISIYPNPTAGLFTITMRNASFIELKINVFDIQGKEVYSALDNPAHSGTDYNKQINLDGIAKGIYYIKLNTGTGIKIQKLIIQ